jgi:hypothetical protein
MRLQKILSAAVKAGDPVLLALHQKGGPENITIGQFKLADGTTLYANRLTSACSPLDGKAMTFASKMKTTLAFADIKKETVQIAHCGGCQSYTSTYPETAAKLEGTKMHCLACGNPLTVKVVKAEDGDADADDLDLDNTDPAPVGEEEACDDDAAMADGDDAADSDDVDPPPAGDDDAQDEGDGAFLSDDEVDMEADGEDAPTDGSDAPLTDEEDEEIPLEGGDDDAATDDGTADEAPAPAADDDLGDADFDDDEEPVPAAATAKAKKTPATASAKTAKGKKTVKASESVTDGRGNE